MSVTRYYELYLKYVKVYVNKRRMNSTVLQFTTTFSYRRYVTGS